MKKELIIFVMIALLIGGLAGAAIGSYLTIKTVAHIASYFIDIDYQTVYDAIYSYQNNLGFCYGGGYNASVYSN